MTEKLAEKPPEKLPEGLARVSVERRPGAIEDDFVAVEEPLEIRLDGEPLAVTMRTPGADRELTAGFLFTEGVIRGPEDLEELEIRAAGSDPRAGSAALVVLSETARAHAERIEHARREFRAVAGCGICGKESLDAIYQTLPEIENPGFELDFLRSLPERMRPHQVLFARTGGIHGAALFDRAGELEHLYEDIGRHNAVDKVIGRALLKGELPLAGKILAVSGRAGFEIVQKAIMAGLPAMVAVGAASSLAVRLAKEAGMTLCAFVAPGRGHRHL